MGADSKTHVIECETLRGFRASAAGVTSFGFAQDKLCTRSYGCQFRLIAEISGLLAQIFSKMFHVKRRLVQENETRIFFSDYQPSRMFPLISFGMTGVIAT